MIPTAIGIDLGGTRIKAVAIDAGGNVVDERNQSTGDGGGQLWKQAVAEVVGQWRSQAGKGSAVVGISAPGLPNADHSAIACIPGRLQGLEGFEWSSFLGVDSYVLNDAVAAMLAEARYGAARDCRNMVMLTLGTGVGGAILINGQPYMGAFGKAGHIGHMVIDSDGEPDICGMPGSLEDAIGEVTLLKRSGGRFSSTQELLRAYREGDEQTKEVWLTSVRKLAIGLASLTNILSPEIIVLGGGICAAGKDLFEPLEAYMSRFEWRTGANKVSIVKAQFGEKAGAFGAACFALERATLAG
jgi:glucokinase